MDNLTDILLPHADPLQSSYLPEGMYFHPYWQKYEGYLREVPDYVHWGIGMYMAFVCGAATLGNLLVIYIFLGTPSLRSPSNVYVINLAVSDLAFSCINGFPLMTISCFNRMWMFGPLACQVYAAWGSVAGFNSVCTLALISYDRYSVISNPLEAMRTASKKKSFMKCLMSWGWAGIWSFAPFFGWGRYITEGMQTSCSFDYVSHDVNNFSYQVCIYFAGFFLPFLFIVYSYVCIIGAVASQAKEMAKTAEKMGAQIAEQQNKARQQEMALVKVAFGTVTLFLASWTPYAFVAQAGVWGHMEYVTPLSSIVPIFFAKASALWNPVIYALSHPKFRAQLEAKFPWLLCCAGSNIDRSDGKSEMSMSASGGSQVSTLSESAAA